MRETSIDYIHTEKTISIFSSDSFTINKLKKLAEDYPEDVKVVFDYTDNDPTVERDNNTYQITVPAKWFRLPKPPRKMNISEEQLQLMKERMSEIGKSRRKN